MKRDTEKKIIELVQKGKLSPSQISEKTGISRQMTQRYLKRLLEQKKIQKTGIPPKVFYSVSPPQSENGRSIILDVETKTTLDQHFYNISPQGKELIGTQGFIEWCTQRNFDIRKKSQEFLAIKKKYEKLKKNNLLDATSKLKKTFGDGADELYYYDFYSIEVFGKTKMGQKLLYAKQTENKRLMKEISNEIHQPLINFVREKKIDAVAFIPPTVSRQTQFMKVLEKNLSLPLPKITITKVITSIRVPQKTLKKLSDRIENANETFVVESNAKFKKVLLIDDAVGSGASINQIAQQMKRKGVAQYIIGFAITGSLNDFDVISEV